MKLLTKLNPNVAAIQPYEPGRPIEEVARELGLDPATIIKLASNESGLGPSPRAMTAVRAALKDAHRYPDGGAYELRGKLAAQFGLERANLVLGNGSNELLELVGHCFLGPGRSAVFSKHAFVVYKLVSVLFGARQIEVPCTPGLGHDLDAMAAAIAPDTAVIFVCNPNNPTGTMVDAKALRRFLGRMPDDVLVVLDEAYAELCTAAYPDSIPEVKAGRNVLICRTFSKSYGLAGLRLGYGLAAPPLARALDQARQPFNVNSLAQAAALAALDDKEFVARNRELCRQGKAYLENQCRRLGLPFIPSFANFMLIEVGDGAQVTKDLQAAGVIVRPMGGYGLPQYLRVTYGMPEENERFVRTLSRVLGR